jgi:hypothetical protein
MTAGSRLFAFTCHTQIWVTPLLTQIAVDLDLKEGKA